MLGSIQLCVIMLRWMRVKEQHLYKTLLVDGLNFSGVRPPGGQATKDTQFRRGMRIVMAGSIQLCVMMMRWMGMKGQRLCGTLARLCGAFVDCLVFDVWSVLLVLS